MPDVIFARFVDNAGGEAMELASRSDHLRVHTDPRYYATFFCTFDLPYLRHQAGGVVSVESGPVCSAVHFPPDYLRSTDPHLYMHVAAVLTPEVVHPNIRGTAVCLGSGFRPGTRISLILRELFEIFSYSNYSLSEGDSLNPMACRLLRAHGHLLERIGHRRLLRRPVHLRVKVGPR